MKTRIALLVLAFVFLAGCSTKELYRTTSRVAYPATLGIVPQREWGGKPWEGATPVHHINRITIHHGGEEFPAEKDPVNYLVGLQNWSRSEKHWVDIPYHYMIDLRGTIYEARPVEIPGDTNTPYDPRGHALICVMGNYEHQILNEAQLSSVISLAAFLAKHFNVPPDSIKGHKDYTETLCPGQNLYRYLQDGTIVSRVQQQLK